MKQSFTSNHLIRFLYDETSALETLAIKEELLRNAELRRSFEHLRQAREQMPSVKFRPSQAAIQNILKYSQLTAVEKEV